MTLLDGDVVFVRSELDERRKLVVAVHAPGRNVGVTAHVLYEQQASRAHLTLRDENMM